MKGREELVGRWGCRMTQGSACSNLSAENGFEPLLYPFFFFYLVGGGVRMRWAGGMGMEREKSKESKERRVFGTYVPHGHLSPSCSFVRSVEFSSALSSPVPKLYSHFGRRFESLRHVKTRDHMGCWLRTKEHAKASGRRKFSIPTRSSDQLQKGSLW